MTRVAPLADTEARVFLGIVAALTVAILVVHFDPGYFTWWSFQVFLFFLLLLLADLLRRHVAWFCFFSKLALFPPVPFRF